MMLFFAVHTLSVMVVVGGLYFYRHWLLEIGYDNPKIAYRPAYVMAPLLVLMLAAGIACGFLGLKGPALSLGISGLLGAGFLVDLLMRFATGRLGVSPQMRRVMMEDL